jgi:hypothetical protein
MICERPTRLRFDGTESASVGTAMSGKVVVKRTSMSRDAAAADAAAAAPAEDEELTMVSSMMRAVGGKRRKRYGKSLSIGCGPPSTTAAAPAPVRRERASPLTTPPSHTSRPPRSPPRPDAALPRPRSPTRPRRPAAFLRPSSRPGHRPRGG